MKQSGTSSRIKRNYQLCVGIKTIYPYDLTLPEPPEKEKIINFGKPIEEQIFRRTEIPAEVKKLNSLPHTDAIKVAESNPAISEFIAKMWYKFTYGEWQYINGEALHISPTYWFYLNFWKIDIGYPRFRYDKTHFCTDLWEFLWWDYMVQPSEVCYGEIQGAARRTGKSYKAMCKAYKRLMTLKNANGSLQSKSEDDALKCFGEKMVMPWTYLPFFFKPLYANSNYPKREGLQFMPRTSRRELKGDDVINPDDYLFSTFLAYSSGETAVDGTKQYIHVSDEDGKAPAGLDVWERHLIVRPCLTDEGRIIGKEIATTTVEDMEKTAAVRFWYKWQMSDRTPNKPQGQQITVNAQGETVSGLWQWFCPARANVVFDRYGCAIIDTPTKEQQEWLRTVKKDPKFKKGGRERISDLINSQKTQIDKQKQMRKYPEEVSDMFLTSTSFCHFDLGILNARLQEFAFGYPPELSDRMTFGNFVWKDGVFGNEVVFVPDSQENSRFWISYLPSKDLANRFKIDTFTGKKIPANWHKFSAGADAFKFDTEDVIHKSEMSKGAMHIYAEYDITVDRPEIPPHLYVTDDFCLEYLWREDGMTVDDLCEDYLKACMFYGCKLFPEKNNPEVVSYFKRNGFENYLEFDREFKRDDAGIYLKEKGGAGANTDSKSIQSMFKVVQRYVKEKGMRCKFYRTLEQFKFVSPDNMNPYDLFVSASTSLRVVQEFNPIRLKEEETNSDIGELAGMFSPRMPEDYSDYSSFGLDGG